MDALGVSNQEISGFPPDYIGPGPRNLLSTLILCLCLISSGIRLHDFWDPVVTPVSAPWNPGFLVLTH